MYCWENAITPVHALGIVIGTICDKKTLQSYFVTTLVHYDYDVAHRSGILKPIVVDDDVCDDIISLNKIHKNEDACQNLVKQTMVLMRDPCIR